jgi:Predicted permeases
MTILDRYISREFIKIFLLVIASFLSLYLIIDFFERIRMFLSNNASFYQIISYFFFKTPMIISQIMPAVVLLSSLLTFGMLSKHSEIIAMKANGVSLYRTSLPVIIISVIVCIFTFLFSEFITPYANQKAEYIKLVEVKKHKKPGSFKQNQMWYRSRDAIYNFNIFDPDTDTLKGVTINYLDRDFQLTMRIDAKQAKWEDGKWVFHNLLITRFHSDDFPSIERVTSRVIDIPEKPLDFKAVQKDIEEMGYLELRDYVKKIQSEGYDATRYLADLHGKIAFPLVSIILAIIGVSFSLRSERSGGVAQSISVGIITGFSYWIVFAFALSLGRSGTLPPLLSAWIANIIFASAAAVMFLRVRT